MRFLPRALLAGGLGFAASVLVACGGSAGLLSSNQASNLNDQLDAVSSAISSGRCVDAANAALGFSESVDGLPGSVNRRLAGNLQQGAAAIRRLTVQDCRAKTSTPTDTTPPNTTPTNTHTTSTPTNPSTQPSTSPSKSPTGTSTSPATTGTGPGTTTTGGNGGVGLPTNTSTGGTGGAGTGGNGNGQ